MGIVEPKHRGSGVLTVIRLGTDPIGFENCSVLPHNQSLQLTLDPASRLAAAKRLAALSASELRRYVAKHD